MWSEEEHRGRPGQVERFRAGAEPAKSKGEVSGSLSSPSRQWGQWVSRGRSPEVKFVFSPDSQGSVEYFKWCGSSHAN